MKRQNETLRKYAFAPFGELLRAMVRDPALLLWLDAPANRKEHPNENLGRELLELFTLGVGNYSEDDVKQAARALTGWTVKQGEFVNQAAAHDGGEKQVRGEVCEHHGLDQADALSESRGNKEGPGRQRARPEKDRPGRCDRQIETLEQPQRE